MSGKSAHILVIDDDPVFCAQVAAYVAGKGHSCRVASTLAEGLAVGRNEPFDLVFLDMVLPDGDGMGIIEGLRRTPSAPEVVVITGQSDPATADQAIRNGAWYYLHKPTPLNAMRALIERIMVFREIRDKDSGEFAISRERIVGESQMLLRCLEQASRAAQSDEYVLVTGETGTGKELVAESIHLSGKRAMGPFVPVDCTAIPETLAESILFGHVKGAFTGADSDRVGLMAQADGGTLFLDEVGDLPMSVQKTLLRTLQEKRFRPLSSGREEHSDFRVIAATNRDLRSMVDSGEFRKDLYYRLGTFTISVPPLRKRLEDVPLLVHHYVDKLAGHYGTKAKQVSDETLQALALHDWPGNVRELVSVVHSMVAAAGREGRIYPHHLPMEIRAVFHASHASAAGKTRPEGEPGRITAGDGCLVDLEVLFPKGNNGDFPSLGAVREKVMEKVEAYYLEQLLRTGPKSAATACTTTGLSRSRLYQLLAKHDLSLK